MNVWHHINGAINPGTAEAAKKREINKPKKRNSSTPAAKASKRASKKHKNHKNHKNHKI